MRRSPDPTVTLESDGMTPNLLTNPKALSTTRRARNNINRILVSTVFNRVLVSTILVSTIFIGTPQSSSEHPFLVPCPSGGAYTREQREVRFLTESLRSGCGNPSFLLAKILVVRLRQFLCRLNADLPMLGDLRTWLDSWSGIGRVAAGMARQGYHLQLTRYDERGWRANFYPTGLNDSVVASAYGPSVPL